MNVLKGRRMKKSDDASSDDDDEIVDQLVPIASLQATRLPWMRRQVKPSLNAFIDPSGLARAPYSVSYTSKYVLKVSSSDTY